MFWREYRITHHCLLESSISWYSMGPEKYFLKLGCFKWPLRKVLIIKMSSVSSVLRNIKFSYSVILEPALTVILVAALSVSVLMSLSLFLNYVPYQSTKIEPLWINNNFGRDRSIFKNWWKFWQSTLVGLQQILHFTITETLQMFITEYFYDFTFINTVESL